MEITGDEDRHMLMRDGTAPTITVPLEPEQRALPSRAPRIIYVALLLIPMILGSAIVLIRTGVIAGRTGTARTPWDLSVIFLGIVAAIVMGLYVSRIAPELRARGRSDASDANLSAWEFRMLLVTTPLSGLLSVLAFLVWAGVLTLGLPSDPIVPLVIGAMAMFLSAAPMAYFDYQRGRQVRAIESRFPDFLRDLNESHASGMTMAQAIRVAARGDYGRLNPEISRMAHQVSWGTSFPIALKMFSDRVGTPLVVRAVALINKATQAGGNVKDVLAAAARDAREIEALDTDRRNGMALYVIVIYVSFFVFLGVVGALQGLLVPSLLISTQGAGISDLGGISVGGRLDLDDFRFIYFGIGIVQSIGSGIVAGVMSEGTLGSGLKHAAIMILCTVLVLGVML